MNFRIRHETVYAYSQPVCLEPQVLRVRPRADDAQRIERFTYSIRPLVAGRTEFHDLEGNSVIQTWFGEPAETFSVTTSFEIETLRNNPFDFIITDAGVLNIPVTYDASLEKFLEPYRIHTQQRDTVTAFSQTVARKSGPRAMDFLITLCREIYGSVHRVHREEGAPRTAAETLAANSGACRDLAVLYIEACRRQGFAARFVSGYWYDSGGTERSLHAWAEVYLPGGGWRGFDPSTGLAVAECHIPVAACVNPAGAAPIVGCFRGDGATAKMQTWLTIEAR